MTKHRVVLSLPGSRLVNVNQWSTELYPGHRYENLVFPLDVEAETDVEAVDKAYKAIHKHLQELVK